MHKSQPIHSANDDLELHDVRSSPPGLSSRLRIGSYGPGGRSPEYGRPLASHCLPGCAAAALLRSVSRPLSGLVALWALAVVLATARRAFDWSPDIFLPPWLSPTRSADTSTPSRFKAFAAASQPLPLDTPLDVRLQQWLNAPIATADEWREYNDQACSKKTVRNEDWHMINPNLEAWQSATEKDVRGLRLKMVQCLRRAEEEGRLSNANFGEGRGLVFTAGNDDTVSRALVTLRILRHHTGLQLPAEIFHYSSERILPADAVELEELGATLRTIGEKSITKEPGVQKNFQIKASAILESSFREVIYLDSDNTPCGGSAIMHLFSAPAYTKHGIWLWPDLWKHSPLNGVWRVLGSQCRNEWEIESGQILVDKSKHLDTLHLAQCMLVDHTTWFTFSNGDKDIFRYALLALRKRWASPGRMVGLASVPPLEGLPFAGHTMIQHDHHGEEMFVHANMLKTVGLLGYQAYEGTTWGLTQRMRIKSGEAEGYVDADMLANADVNGTALAPAPEELRQRAALERGVRFEWLTDSRIRDFLFTFWEDARTDREKRAPSSVEWRDPLEIVSWSESERLKDFEHIYYQEAQRNGKPR